MQIPTSQDLFDARRVANELRGLLEVAEPWHIFAKMDAFLAEIEPDILGTVHPSAILTGTIYLAEGATIEAHACIEGPAWIGAGATVGHSAYIRGGSILAPNVKVGHSSEVKHSFLMNDAKAPHFNYVGDSILGNNANIGAGVKLANFHVLGKYIRVAGVETGRRKFSTAMGDDVSVGCNAVCAPGTIIGKNTLIYAGAMVRGVIPANSMVKLRQAQEIVARYDGA